jgi:hypothetical protein
MVTDYGKICRVCEVNIFYRLYKKNMVANQKLYSTFGLMVSTNDKLELGM